MAIIAEWLFTENIFLPPVSLILLFLGGYFIGAFISLHFERRR